MSAEVIIAYRDSGCEHRQAAHRFVTEHVWAGWRVSIADDGSEPFSRGASFNQGAQASLADVLIFTDADVVPERAALEDAVEHAREHRVTCYPYRRYVRLSKGITPDEHVQVFDWEMWNSVGGIFVCRRDAYLAAGGCDPRFVGWGFEDVAWSATSVTLLGDHVREDGSLLHLWHPWDPYSWTATDEKRRVYDDNTALCDRYTAAIGDAEAIRAIRAEAA